MPNTTSHAIAQPNLSRRSILKHSAAIATATLAASALASSSRAAETRQPTPVPGDPTPVGDYGFATLPAKHTDLGDNVHLLQGPGGNMAVIVGSDGSSIMLDSGVPARGADVVAAVKAVTSGTLPRILLNSHWHFDHAGGNEKLASAGVSTIVAHKNTAKRLSTPQHIAFFNLDVPASPEAARPTLAFAEPITLHLQGGQTLIATAVPPAHTDGDVFVHIERGDVIFTGDILATGYYPFIDYSSGGSIQGMIGAADILLAAGNEKTRYIPGHGEIATKADVLTYRDMLTTVLDSLTALAKKGLTLDDAIAAKPLAPFDKTWGSRAFRSSHLVRIIYPSLLK